MRTARLPFAGCALGYYSRRLLVCMHGTMTNHAHFVYHASETALCERWNTGRNIVLYMSKDDFRRKEQADRMLVVLVAAGCVGNARVGNGCGEC